MIRANITFIIYVSNLTLFKLGLSLPDTNVNFCPFKIIIRIIHHRLHLFYILSLFIEDISLFFEFGTEVVYINIFHPLIKYVIHHTRFHGGVKMKICLSEICHGSVGLNYVPQMLATLMCRSDYPCAIYDPNLDFISYLSKLLTINLKIFQNSPVCALVVFSPYVVLVSVR